MAFKLGEVNGWTLIEYDAGEKFGIVKMAVPVIVGGNDMLTRCERVRVVGSLASNDFAGFYRFMSGLGDSTSSIDEMMYQDAKMFIEFYETTATAKENR